MFSLTLPQKVKGQYWINDIDDGGKYRDLISVEAKQGVWVAKSNKNASLIDSQGAKLKEAPLTDETFLNIRIEGSEEKVILFTESLDVTRQTLTKIRATSPDIFMIGRNPSNQFCCNHPYLSSEHAKLSFDGDAWSITDLDSTNGTYVNGYRIRSKRLEPGDYIYLMGLKIVIGSDYIALNNPGEKLRIKSSSLTVVAPAEHYRREPEQETAEHFFSRSPRFRREIEPRTITIDPPPAPQKLDTVPMALMLGPSITMGMTSVSTGMLTVSNVLSNGGDIRQALPTLVMSVSMLIGTILWPILTKRYEKKQKIKAEKNRQDKYLAYLNEISDKIRSISKEQNDILYENLVTQEECADRIVQQKDNLWERVIGQDDFLRLRLGLGTIPTLLEVKYQEKKFTMEDDTLQNAMLSVAEAPKELRSVPISFNLSHNIAVGIYGKKRDTDDMLKALILQMIALHSYDELKLMLITDEAQADAWSFIKCIPHFWSDDRSIRFFAASQDDTKELTAYIESALIPRAQLKNQQIQDTPPYYVIIAADRNLARKCDGVQKILRQKENIGCSLIFCAEKISDLPKETGMVIDANGEKSRLFHKDDTTGKQIPFVADKVNGSIFETIGEKIANIELDTEEKNFALPTMITFLEMFGVSKVEHLNSLTRWKDHNPTMTLQTPIGVDTFGDAFNLDLHEKFHGPHGLVAGMTGSGKSEFLITYILSLAVNYHPDEVSFILIDYKGGGLAGAFEDKDKGIKLPHLAGVITNLDGAAINRTLVSFQSERRRREGILNKARKIANEGTMDIYKYQQLYRDKVVAEPLPHLFIIADEFAELKAQQPDFMEQLISLARVGRSLGIHLILATQKPSGVVDDQIWSNSKFRVCLKVQERADSQDMIKRPDAAELSQTGRFYLQVGFNELFALGQSAWCGADYIPGETLEKEVDTGIQIIDNLGRTVVSMKPAKQTVAASTKQIVAIVDYLSSLADEEQIAVRALWLDPIPATIYLDQLEAKYAYNSVAFELNPAVGEYDDPFNQRQGILTIPLSSEGNCLVYGSTGSGKTTFITTMITSLIRHHSAAELNLYIMDFGSETARIFEKAPQIGDVVVSADTEKIQNLFRMLKQELNRRKARFADWGGDYQGYVRSGHRDIPNIVVILNNYSAFAELYEDYQDDFTILSRDGVKCGIFFVVTAGSTNAVRYRTQQNFKMALTMQLNDATDYYTVVGKTNGLVPSKFRGRGLVALDRVYEFQTAFSMKADDMQEAIRSLCTELSKADPVKAKPIPVLPDAVDYRFVASSIGGLSGVPVGVNKTSLDIAAVNLDNCVLYPVLAQDLMDTKRFCEGIIRVVSDICSVTVVDTEKILDNAVQGISVDRYGSFVQSLFDAMVERNNVYKDAGLDLGALSGYEPQVIVMIGVKKLVDILSADDRDKFFTLIDKAEAFYGIHFIAVDTVSQLNSLCFDVRIKNKVTGEGLWIGDGVADQYLLKISKITSNLYDEVDSGCGYMVSRGRAVPLKLLTDGEGE